MNIQDLQAEINAIDQETAQIEDSVGRSVVKKLLNIIERLAGENVALESERQELRNEINRLKGEQGKPDIKASKKKDGDISSEAERQEAEVNANPDAGGETAQGGEILWAVTGADGGAILIPIPVEGVVAAVFDGPMAAVIG